MSKLAPEQNTYRLAKVEYDRLFGEYTKRLDARYPLDENMDLDAYEEFAQQLAKDIELPQARKDLAAAEDALIAWGRSRIQHLPEFAANKGDFDALYASKLITVRNKLIAVTMKLAPRG